jgi:hypothetical protein
MNRARNLSLVPPPAWHGKAHDPQARGWVTVYRHDVANYCPGCSRSHWLVGRTSAECAFCATALPLAATVDVVNGRRP